MSLLKFVDVSACPVCNTTTVIEERIENDNVFGKQIRVHTNGGRWEHRKFACGQLVSYIPNYSKTLTSDRSTCAFDPVVLEKNKLRQEFLKSVVNTVRNLEHEVDDSFRDSIITALEKLQSLCK